MSIIVGRRGSYTYSELLKKRTKLTSHLALSMLVLSNPDSKLFILTDEILQMNWLEHAQDLYQSTGKIIMSTCVQIHGEAVSRSAALKSQDPPMLPVGRRPFTRTDLAGRYGNLH